MRAVNLVPPERRVGAGVGLGRSGGGAYAVLAIVGLLALLILVYGKASHQAKSDQAQAQKLTAEATAVQSEAGNLSRYNGLISQSEARTAAVEQLVDTRFDWAHAFHELGRVLPKQVSIASLTGTVGTEGSSKSSSKSSAPAGAVPSSGSASSSASGGASPTAGAGAGAKSEVTSATPPGSVPSFVLSGCATSQTAVAQVLERLRLIDGVKEATLQSSVASVTGSSGSGNCPGSDPTFAVTVVFEPLPAGAPKATATVSNTAGSAK